MFTVRDRTADELWQRRRCLALSGDPPPRPMPLLKPAAAGQPKPSGPDVAWERLQEQALRAFVRGDGARPVRNWLRALEVAETSFDPNDPRLAASLTNCAYAIQQKEGQQPALRVFARALATWDEGWRWIRRMAPPAGEAPYDEAARARFLALLHEGRRATEAISRFQPVAIGGAGRFAALKPARMSDLRALLGAVLLIVPAHGTDAR